MPSIRQDSIKKRWIVDHNRGAFRKRYYFPTRQEAQEFNRLLILKGAGIALEEDAITSITVQEAVERYLITVTATKAPRTQYFERFVFRDFSKYFRGTLLHEVGLSEIQGYQSHLRKRILGQSANRRFNSICHFFSTCSDWNLLKVNPCKKLKKLPVSGQRAKRALQEEELIAVMKAATPWLRDVLWFILALGVRRSQACFLRWSSIDFKNRFVHLEASEGFENKDYEINSLPMTVLTEQFLQRLFENARKEFRTRSEDFVFVDDRKVPIRPDRLTHEAKKLMKRVLGLQSGAVHILRHTSLTMRHRQGVSLDAIRAIAGHSNIKTTMHYLHSETEYLRAELSRTPILKPFWLS